MDRHHSGAMSPVQGRITFHIIPGSPAREYFKYVPATATRDSKVIVLVHGITRGASEQIFHFRALADETNAILIAPYFARSTFGLYQQVIDPRTQARADLALLDMLKAVGKDTGASVDRVHLFGYSGGAQFVHRFVLFHPQRAHSMHIASAGWYTFPDPQRPYPYGIADPPAAGEIDLAKYLSVERHLFIGAKDTGRGDNLRASRRLDAQQGTHRLERACRWYAAMQAASRAHGVYPPRETFEIIPGAGHSFAYSARRRSLPERVMSLVFPAMNETTE